MEQIKVPSEVEFRPLSAYFGHVIPENEIILLDGNKRDRSPYYTYLLQALLAFRETTVCHTHPL